MSPEGSDYDEDVEARILGVLTVKKTDDVVFDEWVRKANACEYLCKQLMESPDSLIKIFDTYKTREAIASTVHKWLGECELDRIEMDGREGYLDIVLLLGKVRKKMKTVAPFYDL